MVTNRSLIHRPADRTAAVAAFAAVAVAVGVGGAFSARAAVVIALAVAIAAGIARSGSRMLLVVLVAAVFLEVLSVGGVTVSRLVTPVAAAGLAVAAARGSLRLSWSSPLPWVVGYSTWALASLIWTTDTGATLYLLGSLATSWVFLLAFAGFVRDERVLRLVLVTVSIVALGVGIFAIASFLGYGGVSTLQEGRASGVVGDANFFAAYQIVAIPLVLALASAARGHAARLGLYAIAALVTASILTTLSRGGLVALALVGLVAAISPSRALFASWGQKLAVAIVVVVGVAVVWGAVSSAFTVRIDSIFSGQDAGSGREQLWRAAGQSIHERPILGLGYGAFPSSANALLLSTPSVSLAHYELRPAGEEVHSAYIGSAAELGLPGLALFLGMLVATGLALRKTSRRARALGAHAVARVSNALLVSLVGWAVASLFLSSETSRPVWIIIGLALALARMTRTGAAGTGGSRP